MLEKVEVKRRKNKKRQQKSYRELKGDIYEKNRRQFYLFTKFIRLY